MYDILELNDKLVGELKEIARQLNIPNYDELRKQELVYKILDQQALNPEAPQAVAHRRLRRILNLGDERRLHPPVRRVVAPVDVTKLLAQVALARL